MQTIYRYKSDRYILSPDSRFLIKAGKKNWRESTKYTDDKGRLWIFNETTRRWGLHPDFKGKKKPAATTPDTIQAEVDRSFDKLNNIMPFDITSTREMRQAVRQIEREIGYLHGLAEEFKEEVAQRVLVNSIHHLVEEVRSSKDLIAKVRETQRERLERIFAGKVDRLTARGTAINKRLFEILHPRKLIRVPKGTTQKEYAEIVDRLANGDKKAIKQYTVNRPKKRKPSRN
jgi:hypothetical protein